MSFEMLKTDTVKINILFNRKLTQPFPCLEGA